MQGAIPPSSSELFRSSDRLSFVYVEHAMISRADRVGGGGRGSLPCCEFERFAVGAGYPYYSSGDGFIGGVRHDCSVGWRAGCSLLCERQVCGAFFASVDCSGEAGVEYAEPFGCGAHDVSVAFSWRGYERADDAATAR